MSSLNDFAMVLIPLAVLILAQVMKFAIFSARNGLNWNYLFSPGHTPSVHAAFVSSLVVAVGYYNGIFSGAFAVAVGFAVIVIYDAVRIRVYIGDQGKFLNRLVNTLGVDKSEFPHMKERVGHYAKEVIAGIITGVTLTFLFIFFLF